MRVAVVGVGRMGALLARLLGQSPRVSDVVVTDPDRSKTGAVLAAMSATVAPTLEAAIDGVDAVVVATPTDTHERVLRTTLGRRVPTFVEKPLALDLAECRSIVELVETTGVPLQLGFQRRFDPAYIEARRLVESGALGTIYLVRLIAHDHEPPPDDYIPRSGGLFRDSSIHDFDALRWLTGVEVEEVYADGSVRNFEVFARSDDIDTGVAILRLTDGTLAVLGQTRHDPRGYDIRMEVFGSRDAVVVGLSDRAPIRSLERLGPTFPGPAWTTFLTRFEDAYRAELAAFLDLVEGRIESPCTAQDGLEAMRIAVAATISRKEHRPVRLGDVVE
jgi:myo-inositol 2-dehydrogenase/D-chiro-inositol 1-dehydrogenase